MFRKVIEVSVLAQTYNPFYIDSNLQDDKTMSTTVGQNLSKTISSDIIFFEGLFKDSL